MLVHPAVLAPPPPPPQRWRLPTFFRRSARTDEAETLPPRDPLQLMPDILEQLESTRGEPLAVRRKIFRELQRQLHPDKNAECEEGAKLAFQTLMERRAFYLRP